MMWILSKRLCSGKLCVPAGLMGSSKVRTFQSYDAGEDALVKNV